MKPGMVQGAVREHPRGTISYVSPRKPPGDHVIDHQTQWDTSGPFGALGKLLNPGVTATDWGESAQGQLHDDDHDKGTQSL
jgi:hypothetical protein